MSPLFKIRHLGLALLIVVPLGVTACGSDDDTSESDSGSVSSAAQKTYDEFSSEITTWPGPDAPVSPPAGKQITAITCGSQGITCVRVANGVKAAGEALGYDVNVVDGQSQPTVWNQAIQTAVASKTDGIVLAAVPPAVVGGAIGAAEAANIPVAAVLSVTGPATVKVDYPRTEVVRANSAFIAEDSGGNAKVLEVVSPEFPETAVYKELYPKELASACSGCEVVDTIDFSLALASQRLAGDVAQALQQNPDVNYIILPFDTVNPFVIQGIRQAGRAGQVKIVGVGADPPSVQAIQAGDQVESLGTPAEWMGWDAVDGLLRSFTSEPIPPLQTNGSSETNYTVPMRYITADNLPGPEGWQGDFDYQAKFKELWGE